MDAGANQPMGGARLMRDQLLAQLEPDALDRVSVLLCTPGGWVPDGRPTILWQHLDVDQPAVRFLRERGVHDCFDRFVFVSHWQAKRYLRAFGTPAERSVVIRNAIHPFAHHDKPPSPPVKVVYTSTPWRGLDILLEAWEHLAPAEAELHVFSGCGLYGAGFARNDVKFEALYRKARDLPGARYRGVVPNDELRRELATAHVLAYPCTFRETSCICAIEALAAGCQVVTSGLGALPETCAGFARMYPYVPDRAAHVSRFASELDAVLRGAAAVHVDPLQVPYFRAQYSWERRLLEWRRLFAELVPAPARCAGSRDPGRERPS